MKDQIKDQVEQKMGTTGLIFNEPLLWEKGSPGRKGMSLPKRDVDGWGVGAGLRLDTPAGPSIVTAATALFVIGQLRPAA